MSELISVVTQRIDALVPNPHNARTHSRHQIRQLADSIQIFGFTNPVLIDKVNKIIAGHGRVAAAKMLGIAEVPTIRLDQLTEDQIRAYVIADNKLAENAGWDKELLAIEFEYLLKLECLDISVTGFEVPEVDIILEEVRADKSSAEQSADDTLPTVEESQLSVCQTGDLWQLGVHRILCGNSLESESFERLMAEKRAAAVFTDPPYNIKIDGNVSGKGQVKHGDFAMASGEMSSEEFSRFLKVGLTLLSQYSAPGAVHYICIDWRHMQEMLTAGGHAYSELLNLCVWVKDQGGQGSFYRSQHELVFCFRNGRKRNRNNIQLGQYGRYRTNVWQYPAVRGLRQQHGEEGNLLHLHPTVKPVNLIVDAILDCTKRGDVVLDAFLGSGSTIIAAERTGRICYGIELDPKFVDVAIRRWQRHTGQQVIHAATGKAFCELQKEKEKRFAKR